MSARTQTIEVPDDIDPQLFTSAIILTLCRLRTGDLVREMSADISQVVNACQTTGKKAQLSLTLTTKTNGVGRVLIGDDPKVKLPRPEQGNTALFTTERGQLVPYDPAQAELALKTVNFPQPQLRQPEAGTAAPAVRAAASS